MTAEGVPARHGLGPLLLSASLAVALGVRIPAVGVPGHFGDVSVVANWAERMAQVGPPAFYQGSGSIYPALLYVYWPLGAALDGEALQTAIKGLAIPFDAAVGLLLYAMVAPRAGGLAGAGAAALYLLNPAVILAGPVWGQIDAAGALALVAALWAASARRHATAAALGILAGLVKPQFGLVLMPVALLAVADWRATGSFRPLLRAGGAAAATYLLIAGPLLLDPVRHVRNIGSVADIRPEASVLAPNPWALLVGYDVPDAPYTGLGAALLVAGLALAMLPLRRRRDLPTLLAVGAYLVFAFYFLPTRVHERYLFPATAVLAPLAAVSLPIMGAYVAMSAAFALSLLYALVAITPFALPQEWEEVLLSDGMVWGMAIVLMAAALTVVLQVSLGAGRRLAAPGSRLARPG